MSRKVPVIGVAIAVLGGMVLAMPAATASTSTGAAGHSMVRFAPAAITKSTSFAGYGSEPRTLTKDSAIFTVPSITCTATNRGVGPGVFLVGNSPIFTGGGAEAVCISGTASYQAAIVINSTETKVLTVAPNDKITVTVSETATASKVTLKDVTSGVSKSSSGAGGAATLALIGDNGIDVNGKLVGVAKFSSNAFTSATVNGVALGSSKPIQYERVNGTTVQLVPTAISAGKAFTVKFKHS